MDAEPRASTDTPRKFILRSPLLPAAYLAEALPFERTTWLTDGSALSAEEIDRIHQERWRALAREVNKPLIAAALQLSSRSLVRRLTSEIKQHKVTEKTVHSSLKYLIRMSTRSTPFGLSATITVGEVGTTTSYKLHAGRLTRIGVTLDGKVLSDFVSRIKATREFRDRTLYQINQTGYKQGDTFRYFARIETDDYTNRSFSVAAIDAQLHELLSLPRTPSSLRSILGHLHSRFPTTDQGELRTYLDALVDAGLLTSTLEIPVLGPDAVGGVLAQLEAIGHSCSFSEALTRIAKHTESATAWEALGETVRETERVVQSLGVEVPAKGVLYVSSLRPAVSATLSVESADYLTHIVERMLERAPASNPITDAFSVEFTKRFGDYEIPLLEALDPESGVSTFCDLPRPDIIADLPSDPIAQVEQPAQDCELHRLVYERRIRALSDGSYEARITRRELESIMPLDNVKVPKCFTILCSLIAPSNQKDEALFHLHSISVGTTLALFARHTTHFRSIRALTDSLDKAEAGAADNVGTVVADICFLPTGRLGNVVSRTCDAHGYYIPIFSPEDPRRGRALPLSDILVSVSGRDIILRSKNHGFRIRPRLGNAHNFTKERLGIYRFLCQLQYQRFGGLHFGWPAALRAVPFRPRLVIDKVMVAPASWAIPKEELREILSGRSLRDRMDRLRRLVQKYRLPRLLFVKADFSDPIEIDLELLASIEVFLKVIQNSDGLILMEVPDGSAESVVRAPDGYLRHQILLPVLRDDNGDQSGLQSCWRSESLDQRPPVRGSTIGGEWLSLKLYCAPTAADEVIAGFIPPVLQSLRERLVVDQWFFLRYRDPLFHIRFRIRSGDLISAEPQ